MGGGAFDENHHVQCLFPFLLRGELLGPTQHGC